MHYALSSFTSVIASRTDILKPASNSFIWVSTAVFAKSGVNCRRTSGDNSPVKALMIFFRLSKEKTRGKDHTPTYIFLFPTPWRRYSHEIRLEAMGGTSSRAKNRVQTGKGSGLTTECTLSHYMHTSLLSYCPLIKGLERKRWVVPINSLNRETANPNTETVNSPDMGNTSFPEEK